MRDRKGMLALVVREITRETPTIVSVRLEHPEGEPLPSWAPGAHIDLQLVTRHERQYSLCGDPSDARSYRIAVLDEPLSRGASHYVHRHLRVGSRVHVRPPRNLFELVPADSHLLLAAGIGITPILAMARRLAGSDADWRVVYAVRRAEDAAFGAELRSLDGGVDGGADGGVDGGRVTLHVSGERGRLDLGAVLRAQKPGTAVYACGPSGFIDDLTRHAAELPAGGSLHTERFEPVPRDFRPDEPFEVVCSRSELTVPVPAGQTMLHALRGAGIDAAGSCLRGVCGSCALPLLGGEAEHRDSLGADASSAVVYPCVSRSLTPQLVVEA